MPVPEALANLVSRFEEQKEAYKSGSYNETQLRIDFLDPFFTLLGWDMHNTSGHAEAYRDVIHEDEVRVGGALKAPDYGFRIGGTRKFFLEAKKPSVVIKDEVQPAYQLRRYAWSAKLPLSVLSDFEEFAIYDCRIKPKPSDKASTARLFYCTYRDYLDKWDEIAAIFSKDAILKGSFDKYASSKGRRGTAEVDEDFLSTIEVWRSDLASDLAKRNAALTERDLNFAVQKILDRIIFLRICEDRGMEDYGRLRALASGPRIYPRLTELFRAADTRYNSGLFHFQPEKGRDEGPDELTLDLEVDDKLLRDLLKQLYYPESPYEFRVLSSDILGQVYEQFLGKVIRLTPSHKAEVDDKPEVKKAGGVYYTPTYIVDYIVRETVGVLIQDKTPKQISSIRVLDPACGSGSFLIGAYQFLLDWYLKYYLDHDPATLAKGKRPVLIQTPGGWRLSIEERKRILLAHIHGVDIDSQAVEVTKLSLLLKVLEGETSQSLQPLFQIFHERALPDLGKNIKCGNSLIGSDFYAQPDLPVLSDEEKLRVNVFDWDGPRGFQQIMKDGGFDAVIGNPPYVRMESFKELKTYFKSHYQSHEERADLYSYFIERGHQILCKDGRFGMIVSNKFLRSNYGLPLRNTIKTNGTVEKVVDLAGLPVFKGATVRTIVLITRRRAGGTKLLHYIAPPSSESFEMIAGSSLSIHDHVRQTQISVDVSALDKVIWNFTDSSSQDLLNRIVTTTLPLGIYAKGKICRGIVSGLTKAFIVNASAYKQLLESDQHSSEILLPVLNGRDIRRFHIDWPKQYLIYTRHGTDLKRYPAIAAHLKPYKAELENRATQQEWFELQQPQAKFFDLMRSPKIVFPDIAISTRFALDDKGFLGTNTTYFIANDDRYLLGLLNSRLGNFYFKDACAGLEGKNETYLRFFGQYLEKFPIRVIDPKNPADLAARDRLVALVEEMLALHQKRTTVKNPPEQAALDAQISATDTQIDRLVYTLYGLTEEEIRIVEGTA
jgi:hypothetical protein